LVRRNILVAIGGGYKGKAVVVQLDHDLCDCPFGKWVGFLFLNSHQLSLEELQLIVDIHHENDSFIIIINTV